MADHPSSQLDVCTRFGVTPAVPAPGSKLGVARNLRSDLWPVNGLRHPESEGTNGWYLWAGEELRSDPDFFVPLHLEHVQEWNEAVVPYLALPPGWRFLVAPGHEDVWRDTALLDI